MALMFNQFSKKLIVVVVFFSTNWHMELRGWQSNPADCFPSLKKKKKQKPVWLNFLSLLFSCSIYYCLLWDTQTLTWQPMKTILINLTLNLFPNIKYIYIFLTRQHIYCSLINKTIFVIINYAFTHLYATLTGHCSENVFFEKHAVHMILNAHKPIIHQRGTSLHRFTNPTFLYRKP